ncbi:hypothetical protein cypCar_00029180, partial [Cyprinus carpio]
MRPTHSGTMSKVKNKKRNLEENEDEQLPIFDKDGGKDGHLDDGDEDQGDLSDSEESVFSGLEDSGSDSDDEEEEEDDEEEEDGTEEKSSDVEEDKAAGGDGDDQLSAKEVTEPQRPIAALSDAHQAEVNAAAGDVMIPGRIPAAPAAVCLIQRRPCSRRTDGQHSKEKKKKKKTAGKEGGEESVVSARDSGLQTSSQVDEYEHDTSDEE